VLVVGVGALGVLVVVLVAGFGCVAVVVCATVGAFATVTVFVPEPHAASSATAPAQSPLESTP
jgi:hypothetical protein